MLCNTFFLRGVPDVCFLEMSALALADLGGVAGAILLFPHTFLPKSARVRGPRPN